MAGPEVFEWDVKVGDQGDTKLRILKAQFGDGYVQKAADGMNNKVTSWNISVYDTIEAITPITDFLDWHGGYKAFYWTPPYGVATLYTCEEYKTTREKGAKVTLTATFEQDFRP